MKIDLEVLASTDIKRKKPWPKIIWIGEEQESLLLLDTKGKRISVLYVPSGKTKKRLPKLSPFADQLLYVTKTKNGRYLVGILENGEIFVWHKDKDIIKFISGLTKLVPSFSQDECYMVLTDDCNHLFVAIGNSHFFLWEMEKGESASRDHSDSGLKGGWHKIAIPEGIILPTSESRESTVAGIYYESPVLGHCMQFSVVYNRAELLSIATLVLKFPDPVESFGKNAPIFSAEWSLLEYPFQQMHPNFEPISTPGAYVSSYSSNGQVLGIAANQRSPEQTAMLFVSPLTDTVLVGDMRRCGINESSKTGRQYWISDLAWTSDSLFLACILKNGSVCLIPRLGEPCIIQSQGYSVDMGPSYYLPLHPAIFVSENKESLEPSTMEQDPMQQKFSLATHPSLPIILFTDGFLVTVVQLPVEMTPVTLMRDLVISSARHLKKVYEQENLDMTVADAYKLSKGTKQAQSEVKKHRRPYEFEMAEITLNSTHDSETSMIETNKFGFDQFGAIGNIDAGKIVFGEPEMITVDPNMTFSGLSASDALLKYLETSMGDLTQAWRLAVSHSDIWTAEVDNIAKQTVHNLSKIFSIVLDCPAVEAIIPALTPRQSSAIQNTRVYNVIVAYRNILQLLRFDTYNQHLLPATLRLVHKTITLMLTSHQLETTDPKIKTLFGSYSLLKHAETSLNRTYVWVPSQSEDSIPSSDGSPRRYEPAVMVKVEKQSTGSDVRGVRLDQQGQLPGKRLAATWKLLYKHVVDYQSKISAAGDPKGELPHVEKLMFTIQQTLQEADVNITPRKASAKLSSGEKHSVDGEHTLAVEAWKEQLKILAANKKDSPKTAKMLHSVLYTYLLKDELSQAVDFIDGLIFQASIDGALNSQELPAYDDGSRPPLMTLVTHRSQDSEEEELVPCVKNKSIRQTVQTMARYMASYFSNKTMFIFPPHSSQALPSVHLSDVPTKSRIVPKYHEDVTNIITKHGLSNMWTTERCVEYLLLSGLICETAWFANKMGDWKTAFLLSVAHTSHREIAPQLYRKPKKPLQLPTQLSPHSILQDKLEVLINSNKAGSAQGVGKLSRRYFIPINQETNIPQLTKTLTEILTAGIMCDVELAPWLLSNLTDKLKSVVSNLPPLVPQDFYLPSPPLYCPQPGEVEMERDNPDVQYERELRMEISSIIQLILVSFNSAHLSLPTARWYIQELFKVQERARQFKATTEGPAQELPEILQQYKILRSDIAEYSKDDDVGQVMTSFRDFCTILWLLHVRDELSLKIRKRGSQLTNANIDGMESPESTLGQEYVQECFGILKWAVSMLNFTQYIADDGCIHKVVLSLILELPKTEDTADILAEHFYDAESFDAEIQEKLERLVSSWQSVEILPEDDGKSARVDDGDDVKRSVDDEDDEDDGSVRKSVTFYQASPRAKTLSVYFHKQCDVVQKVIKKKRKVFGCYEEFVFKPQEETDERLHSNGNSTGHGINIGSRPFETKQSYLEFLDRLYAICFTKAVEKESESGPTSMYPVLMPFARVIRETEFRKFITKQDDTYQKRPSSVVMASPRAKFFRSQSESHVDQGYESKPSPSSAQRRSLFRSNSSGDMQAGRYQTGMSRYTSESSLFARNRTPGSPSRVKGNMTGMASRFFQSEDVLYRGPGDSQEAHWILDVNFGQRYLALQQLLDYLHYWCNKHHSLGLHGKTDKELGIKPTMRIEVPTQLVVLGLWLLEHKYSSQKLREKPVEVEVSRETTAEAPQVAVRSKANNLATVEEVTEHDSFTQVSNIARSRSLSTGKPRSRSHSPRSRSTGFNLSGNRTLESVRSITSTQEETEQVKSAYKKVLDGGDESSSLEVSSLEPDDYEEDLKHTLSVIGSDKAGRGRSSKRRKSPRKPSESPDSRNNSAFNNTLGFGSSPERNIKETLPPQTSTPVRNRSPVGRKHKVDMDQNDISRISATHQDGVYTVPPPHYRSGLLGGDPARSAPPGENILPIQGENNQQNVMGMNLAQQLKHIVRGELRRMMEVQHRSMMAMMGALDGQQIELTRPDIPAPQGAPHAQPPVGYGQQESNENLQGSGRRKGHPGNVLKELKNLQREEEKQKPRRKSKSPGKENIVDSTLRVSALQNDVEVYRITQDPNKISLAPRFLKMEAEKDSNVRLPVIPQEAWASRDDGKFGDVPDMPLLHVERTVPGQVFPGVQRRQALSRYKPKPGFFQPPSHIGGHISPAPGQISPPKSVDSLDSGIGIPLLKLPSGSEPVRRQPKFGELLPPEYVMENWQELQKQEEVKQRYMREFHMLQAQQAEGQYKQRFGENLLHLPVKADDTTDDEVIHRHKDQATSPRKSPRKTPRSISEQISSKKEKPKKTPRTPRSTSSKTEKVVDKERDVSEKALSEPMKEEDSGEEAESEEEDMTEAPSVEEEEEELHDGFAFKQGEFEAYLALEKQLAQTKDTHARIQLKTALRLQQQRMTENWRKARRKVDFATNTAELIDAVTEADSDLENIRTSEKATSITKDTGVDPIQEAVIEYNKSRQPNVLPPDIYMGLRFNEAGSQPSSSVTGHHQDSRGRSYLNVVDVDASAVLRDLKETADDDEPKLDVPLTETQQHIRRRMALEDDTRTSLEPVIDKPTHADNLTVKMFESRAQGEDRLSIAIMPRESMPESKYAIMQRLRDMNTQLAAIDRMSNNMEREFKSTRLALHTLEEMTNAMEPPTAEEMEDQQIAEKPYESPAGSRSLTPQPSAKSPTQSTRATARSSARTMKSSKGDRQQLSTELAKVSGLSGISDIIGDMVAKGDIDLNDVGLSAREAERLVQRGIIRKDEVEEARVSLNDIKEMAHRTKHIPGGYDKDTLHQWMAAKRHERMDQYKRHIEELREREVRPFKSKPTDFDQSLSVRERKAMEETRKASSKAFMTRRLGEAQELLGDIITEKPELPKEPLPQPTPKHKPVKDRSPARASRAPVMPKTFQKDRSPIRKPVGILRRDVSPPSAYSYDPYNYPEDIYGYDEFREDVGMEPEDNDVDEKDIVEPAQQRIVVQPRQDVGKTDFTPSKPPVKKEPGLVPKLKLSLDDVEEEPALQQTTETTGELSEYYRAVQAMDHDVSLSQEQSYEKSREFAKDMAETEVQQPAPSPQKTFKVKPFSEIVRLQRPHVTRKQPNKLAIETAARVKTMSQSETARTSARTEPTQREREMIYGSKRLPGKKPTETGPRRVKTYAERLQEMKSDEKYSTPVAPRSHYGSSIASTTARPQTRFIKPKHKPMTYVEQLQKLNEGHHKPKMGKTTVLQKTMVKSHRPPHRPKTYAEQLQELQPHKPGSQKRRVQKTSPAARQRPYKDPYVPVDSQGDDQWDRDSVVSAWSMGSDVRHVLYDDAESSVAVGQSASYAPSEQVSDYYDAVMGDDYTASVDIDDLVRIADDGTSLSGGSVMSYIDWDEVDDLIADVN